MAFTSIFMYVHQKLNFFPRLAEFSIKEFANFYNKQIPRS